MAEKLIARCGAGAGDLLLFGAGDEGTVNKAMDRVRQFVAKTLDMVPEGQHAVLWITDFPMFEWNEDENRLEALHHPFTAPNQEDVANGGDIKQARAIAYDLVYNGVELAADRSASTEGTCRRRCLTPSGWGRRRLRRSSDT